MRLNGSSVCARSAAQSSHWLPSRLLLRVPCECCRTTDPARRAAPAGSPPPRVLLGASTSHRAAAGAGLSASEETRRLCSPKHPAHPVMHFASGTAEPGASEGVGGCSHGTCLRADEAAVTGN